MSSTSCGLDESANMQTQSLSPKIVIHAGAHKTGTTLIQSYLTSHFQQPGYFYLNPQIINASGLLEAVHGTDKKTIDFMAVARQAGWEPGQIILVSHESLLGYSSIQTVKRNNYFYGDFRENAVRLKNLLAGWSIDVIYYVRRQDDFIVSVYQELLATAFTDQDFDSFLSSQELPRVSWERVLTDLAEAFGEEQVHFGLFDEIQAGSAHYIAGFLRRAGLDIREEDIPQLGQERPSFSQIAYEMATTAMKSGMNPADRRILNHFLRKNFSSRTHPPATLLTMEQRTALLHECEASNLLMFRKYFPDRDPQCWQLPVSV